MSETSTAAVINIGIAIQQAGNGDSRKEHPRSGFDFDVKISGEEGLLSAASRPRWWPRSQAMWRTESKAHPLG